MVPRRLANPVDLKSAGSLNDPWDAVRLGYYLLTEPFPHSHYLTNHLYLLSHRHSP